MSPKTLAGAGTSRQQGSARSRFWTQLSSVSHSSPLSSAKGAPGSGGV